MDGLGVGDRVRVHVRWHDGGPPEHPRPPAGGAGGQLQQLAAHSFVSSPWDPGPQAPATGTVRGAGKMKELRQAPPPARPLSRV